MKPYTTQTRKTKVFRGEKKNRNCIPLLGYICSIVSYFATDKISEFEEHSLASNQKIKGS